MSIYVPPVSSGILFNFIASGYEAPSSSGIAFTFASTYSSYTDLTAFIDGLSVGGSADLSAFARPAFPSNSDLGSFLQTILPVDLSAFVRSVFPEYKNLNATIRRIDKEQFRDLGGYLRLLTTRDLSAFIGSHLPSDLRGSINAWHRETTKNLSTFINGELFKGFADILALITADLPYYFDLPVFIKAIYNSDIVAFIQSVSIKDLRAVIQSVASVNLTGILHGWDEEFLSAAITGVYGPYDLQAYLRVCPYLNLPTSIWGRYSGIKNLQGIIEGTYKFDLGAVISAISAIDLGATLMPVGKIKDLLATIIPNVIRLKQAIQIALLEHKDLKALINFQCGHSSYSDLGVAFGIVYKKLDLPVFIWGWKTADKVSELRAYINTATSFVEDKLFVRLVSSTKACTQLRIRFGIINKYIVFDTLPIFYTSRYTSILSAYVNAVPRSVDLSAVIQPLVPGNYTELPDNIKPKSHVLVLKYNEKWQEQWRKFVEIMFKKDGGTPYHYFYVDGTGQVYKIDRTRHWTIWASSYDKDEETMFDRANVRTKFIFNMSKYRKMDEAIKDLIDRVSAYREADLSASIDPIDTIHLDLDAYINSVGRYKHKWAKYLGATINGI